MQNITSHINMGNAPDVIGRGSDSAPYFMSSSTKDMTRTWKQVYPCQNISPYQTKKQSSNLQLNTKQEQISAERKIIRLQLIFQSAENRFPFCGDYFQNGVAAVLSYIFTDSNRCRHKLINQD